MSKIYLLSTLLFLLFNKIHSLSRLLHIAEEKCILNDFFVKSNIIITFNITEGDIESKNDTKQPLFEIRIYNKNKNKLIKKYETSKNNSRFSFNVEKTGHYKICVKSYDNEIYSKKNYVIFDLKTESNIDVIHNNNETANLKDFEKVNQKLSFLRDKVEQIENMQIMSNSLENNFSKSQINISYRLVLISVIQIIIIFSVGIYHVYSLKIMFKDKAIMPF